MIVTSFVYRGNNYILTEGGTLYRWTVVDPKKPSDPGNWSFTFVAQL